MLKLTGSILIFIAATLFGASEARGIQKRYDNLKIIQKLIYGFKSEIQYKKVNMRELFAQLQKRYEEPYKTWCIHMMKEVEKKDGHTFGEKWKETVIKDLSETGLLPQDLSRLSMLGNELESIDIQMQSRSLQLYIEEMEHEITELRQEKRWKMNLRYCLGITSGLVIIMIFL